MKAPFAPAVWLAGSLLLLGGATSPNANGGQGTTKHHSVLIPWPSAFDESMADACLRKEPEQLTLTLTVKSEKGRPPDWSGMKAWAGCWPFAEHGGSSFDMTLVSTGQVSRGFASAVFVLRADQAIIESLSDVFTEKMAFMDSGSNVFRHRCQCFQIPLSREEVLARFRARASSQEVRRLVELRTSRKPEDKDRALELVLFKLTEGELERIGIQQHLVEPHVTPYEWVVAHGSSQDGTERAVYDVLEKAQIHPGGFGWKYSMTWSVPRGQFFLTRRALLTARDPRVRRCVVPLPRLQL